MNTVSRIVEDYVRVKVLYDDDRRELYLVGIFIFKVDPFHVQYWAASAAEDLNAMPVHDSDS